MILVTGASGYIGSHTCLSLLEAGHQIVAVDNLSNSDRTALERVEKLGGKSLTFFEEDILNTDALHEKIKDYPIQAVIHFAALKCVGEAVAEPLRYYRNNIAGLISLLDVVHSLDIKEFVFSSSATVYGASESVPFTEDSILGPVNPYGQSKLMGEQILRDYAFANPETSVALLRYFNPVGAHDSGLIGEDPEGIPNNLMPFIAQVAVGKREAVTVFGSDFDTPDGTGVRDYLHVMDLAAGHVKAIDWTEANSGVLTVNLGTGRGHSVLEVINTFSAVSGKEIPYVVGARRPGDVAVSFADPSRAREELKWEAKRDLKNMCESMWRWQSQNPSGYRTNSSS